MKTAKAPPAEASSSRRSQPVRQTRTNPPRANSGLNRSMAGRDSLASAHVADQPIDIFPAVTHFADAITALPKELVRHFTLLKEVDSKIFAPEEALLQLIEGASNAPPPDPVRSPKFASIAVAPTSASTSAQHNSSGVALTGHGAQIPSPDTSTSVFDPANLPRRQLFRQTALKIQEMLVSLEEKNHVISTANDALQKQLARIDDVWPHLEHEFSEEAKYGSDTHWAYPENRAARDINNQAERTRREGAASLSAAAQSLAAEEAAARSDARKQAVAAKKSQKNHPHPSEQDDHDGKARSEPTKKSQSSKRKTAAAPAAETAANVGLGISTPTPSNGNPAPKRRKVEKPANGGAPIERAMVSVFGSKETTKAKPSASPRETPVPEPAKKRKALPSSNGQSKKRAGPGATPSVTSSPVISAFPDNPKPTRASPAPSIAARPASSRARQSSTQPNTDSTKRRPSAAASTVQNGVVPVLPDVAVQNNAARAPTETKTQMEPPASTGRVTPKSEGEPAVISSSVAVGGTKKESSARPADEIESRKETTPAAPVMTTTTLVTTKSGRASKPSTPAIGTFAEAVPRPRPSRNSESNNAQKRSHKKGASAAAAAAAKQALAAQQQKAEEDNSSIPDDDEVDENEPLYCYCNSISYGSMVGCDGPNCKREWFHLECVGLKVAPKANVKWYCEDCKEQLKHTTKKANGR